MTTLLLNTFRTEPAKTTAHEVTLPEPQAFGAPVFIGDCASPLAGETVLSLLWKRLNHSDQ